jgi:hypothetical protein
MADELKPCPFCGTAAHLNEAKTHARGSGDCNCTPWLFVEDWNRRAAPAAKTVVKMENTGAENGDEDERDYGALYAIRIQEHDGVAGYWMIGKPGSPGTWMTRDDLSWVGPERHVVEWHKLADPERSVLFCIPDEGAAHPAYSPQDGARCADEHSQLREGVEADLERIRREAGSKPPG